MLFQLTPAQQGGVAIVGAAGKGGGAERGKELVSGADVWAWALGWMLGLSSQAVKHPPLVSKLVGLKVGCVCQMVSNNKCRFQ